MRDKEATREKILSAAEAAFAEKGYHETLMDEIGQAAQTSKGAIYFHFPSKEKLFFALMDRLASMLQREVAREIAQRHGALAKVQGALEAVLTALGRHRQLAKLLLLQGYGLGSAFEAKRLEIYTQFAALIQEHLEEAVAESSIPPLDAEVTAYAWLGAINELIVRWLLTGRPDLKKRALPTLSALFLQGVRARSQTD
jgi:AcrR family transcriptional regulator